MINHLYMSLDDTLSLLGQAEALHRVKALPGVFNARACTRGYKIELTDPACALSVARKARDINCVDYAGPCRHLAK